MTSSSVIVSQKLKYRQITGKLNSFSYFIQ